MIFTLLMAATTLAITWIMAQTPSLASPGTPLGVRVPKAYLSDPAVTSALAGFKVRTWTCGIAATVLSLFAWKLPLLAAVPSLVVALGGMWAYLSQRRRIIAAKKRAAGSTRWKPPSLPVFPANPLARPTSTASLRRLFHG